MRESEKNMNDIILTQRNGQVLANSRDVAEKFDKQHGSVLKTIYGETRKGVHINGLADDILASGNPLTKYFIESEYENRGKKYKECLMTRDGFSLVVMGFTGKDAILWKLKYIDAFNKMEEKLKSGEVLSKEEKYKLMLFSNDATEVAYAHKKLVELATESLVERIEEQKPKVEYHDEVLKKDGLITTTVVAKDLGYRSPQKLNEIMNLNHIIFKNQSGTWCPYAEYEWLITEGYADYQSYTAKNAAPCLKWTEKGRKWIFENHDQWVKNTTAT